MWNKSKLGFASTAPSMHIQLEKKSLTDVLGKMVAEKKEQQDKESKPLFIFGSKIADRVIVDRKENEDGAVVAPKSAEDLFKNAAQKTDRGEKVERDFRAEAVEEAEKLKEQEKQHASTSIVTVTTGEEDDDVMFQTACKLHSFDKERKKWVEKGLSTIKINRRMENNEVHYRIVARTTGNHRVVINSKVFADMLLERVDGKRIKISATGVDSSAVQIFLITIGFSKTEINIDQLFGTLSDVLNKEKALSSSGGRKRKADDGDASEAVEAKKEVLSDFAEYAKPREEAEEDLTQKIETDDDQTQKLESDSDQTQKIDTEDDQSQKIDTDEESAAPADEPENAGNASVDA